GAELGATGTVFPSDQEVKRFLKQQEREEDYEEILADKDATYDIEEEIDLSSLEPLIAKPSSPGNVVPVAELVDTPIYQSYLGSSANRGFGDFPVRPDSVKDKHLAPGVSFTWIPTSGTTP